MERKKKSFDFIIPIISILFAVASFFTGRFYEYRTYESEYRMLELEKETLKTELQTFEKRLNYQTDQEQKEIQLKYIELLSESSEKERLFKADLLINLIEDPQTRIKFSNYTQSIIKTDARDKENGRIIELKGRFANTSFEARKEIENENDKTTDFIKAKTANGKVQVSKSDSIILDNFDKIEQNKIETKYNVYTEFISFLDRIKRWYILNNNQIDDYLTFHAMILENYANTNLKVKMNEVFEATLDRTLDKDTKKTIDELISTLENELNEKLWVKAGHSILWEDVKCKVVNVLPSEKKVFINLVDTENNSIIKENFELKEKEKVKIEEINATLELVKIDNAGKNFLNKAGYFKLID